MTARSGRVIVCVIERCPVGLDAWRCLTAGPPGLGLQTALVVEREAAVRLAPEPLAHQRVGLAV
jgi:hypothetical protein